MLDCMVFAKSKIVVLINTRLNFLNVVPLAIMIQIDQTAQDRTGVCSLQMHHACRSHIL